MGRWGRANRGRASSRRTSWARSLAMVPSRPSGKARTRCLQQRQRLYKKGGFFSFLVCALRKSPCSAALYKPKLPIKCLFCSSSSHFPLLLTFLFSFKLYSRRRLYSRCISVSGLITERGNDGRRIFFFRRSVMITCSLFKKHDAPYLIRTWCHVFQDPSGLFNEHRPPPPEKAEWCSDV